MLRADGDSGVSNENLWTINVERTYLDGQLVYMIEPSQSTEALSAAIIAGVVIGALVSAGVLVGGAVFMVTSSSGAHAHRENNSASGGNAHLLGGEGSYS
jgi:hypothetical protein